MIILSAKPNTKLATPSTRASRSHVSFFVDAELQCPSCSSQIIIQSPSLELVAYNFENGVLTRPDHYADNATIALSAQRNCQNCGVVSVAPTKNREQIRQQLLSIVTTDWVMQKLVDGNCE